MSCSMCLRDSDCDICDECETYARYYESLDAAGRREEEEMIVRHVEESEGL